MKKKRILITGASGFVASHLSKRMCQTSYEITLLSCDIKDFKTMMKLYSNMKFEYIYQFAAKSSPQTAIEDPLETYKVNIEGTWNIMELSKKTGTKCVFFASTQRLSELDERKYSVYDSSKNCAEMVATSYGVAQGVSVVILRLGSVFGEGDKNNARLIPGMVLSLLRNIEHRIYSPGNTKRKYIYIKDVIDAIFYLTNKVEHGLLGSSIFDVCYQDSVSIKDIVIYLVSMSEKKNLMPLLIDADKSLEVQVDNKACLSMSDVDWKLKYSFKQGLANTYFWYKDRFEEENFT